MPNPLDLRGFGLCDYLVELRHDAVRDELVAIMSALRAIATQPDVAMTIVGLMGKAWKQASEEAILLAAGHYFRFDADHVAHFHEHWNGLPRCPAPCAKVVAEMFPVRGMNAALGCSCFLQMCVWCLWECGYQRILKIVPRAWCDFDLGFASLRALGLNPLELTRLGCDEKDQPPRPWRCVFDCEYKEKQQDITQRVYVWDPALFSMQRKGNHDGVLQMLKVVIEEDLRRPAGERSWRVVWPSEDHIRAKNGSAKKGQRRFWIIPADALGPVLQAADAAAVGLQASHVKIKELKDTHKRPRQA